MEVKRQRKAKMCHFSLGGSEQGKIETTMETFRVSFKNQTKIEIL